MEKVTPAKLQTSCLPAGTANLKLQKISMLTAYDYSLAKILDSTEVDVILVGDSLGNVILGYEDTRPVTMDDMLHHTRAVARGVNRALLVADMPMGSVASPAQAVQNARLLVEAGAEGVKVEGIGSIESIKAILKEGIPVMGHLGCLPQTAKEFKIQRSTQIVEEAQLLEKAGVFAVVLELVEKELAKLVTQSVNIPTIGCGSGPHCDGQVLVTYDLLGLYPDAPKHAKKYVDLAVEIRKAVDKFRAL